MNPNYGPPGNPNANAYNQMNYAQWIDRVLAALIDGGLILAAELVLFVIVGLIGGAIGMVGGVTKTGAISALGSGFCCIGFALIPIAMLVAGLYNKVFLISKRGYSIGQGIMKLKVVDQNGNIIDLGKSVLRLLVQMGFSLVPFLSLISLLFPLWDPQRQTLHDKAIGTFVIKVG